MNKFALYLINLYQKFKNPNRINCRFHPTCSNYAKEAYIKFNFFYASFLTFYRILRCHPFAKGGYDPVPLNIIETSFSNLTNSSKISKTIKLNKKKRDHNIR